MRKTELNSRINLWIFKDELESLPSIITIASLFRWIVMISHLRLIAATSSSIFTASLDDSYSEFTLANKFIQKRHQSINLLREKRFFEVFPGKACREVSLNNFPRSSSIHRRRLLCLSPRIMLVWRIKWSNRGAWNVNYNKKFFPKLIRCGRRRRIRRLLTPLIIEITWKVSSLVDLSDVRRNSSKSETFSRLMSANDAHSTARLVAWRKLLSRCLT